MKVEATQKGFIDGKLREEGDQFTTTEKQFSAKWMKKLSKPGPKPAAKPASMSLDA